MAGSTCHCRTLVLLSCLFIHRLAARCPLHTRGQAHGSSPDGRARGQPEICLPANEPAAASHRSSTAAERTVPDRPRQVVPSRTLTALMAPQHVPQPPRPAAAGNHSVQRPAAKLFRPISRKRSYNARPSLVRALVSVQPVQPPQARLPLHHRLPRPADDGARPSNALPQNSFTRTLVNARITLVHLSYERS